MIVLIVPVGAMMGGFIMDSIGRLNTIKIAAIPGVIGWSLIAMANNVPMLITGRLLTGLASGNHHFVPPYLISPFNLIFFNSMGYKSSHSIHNRNRQS